MPCPPRDTEHPHPSHESLALDSSSLVLSENHGLGQRSFPQDCDFRHRGIPSWELSHSLFSQQDLSPL